MPHRKGRLTGRESRRAFPTGGSNAAFIERERNDFSGFIEPSVGYPTEEAFASPDWVEQTRFAEEGPSGAHKCPTCQSDNTRISRFERQDSASRRLLCRPYRCRRCGRHFLIVKRRWIGGSVSALLGLFSLPIILASGAASLDGLLPANPTNGLAIEGQLDKGLDPAEAKRLAKLEDAAKRGDSGAQFELGSYYLDGSSTRQDLALARTWMSRAAEQGHAGAQTAIGHMHRSGRGALQSFVLAHEWLTLAARQDDAAAQYTLGIMYREGEAVEPDRVLAYTWFNLAAANGHEEATDARNDLLPLLTSEQVMVAQAASEQWQPGDLLFVAQPLLAASADE